APGGGAMRFPMMDKLQHLISFLALTLWFAGAYEKRHYLHLGIGLLLFGLSIEIVQGQTSHRTADLYDFLADALGVGLGLGLALAGFGRWCYWVESLLGVRPRV
ncbi:MAG: VanZ family protein, partial [Pseudomonadota bacterium]